MELKKIHMDDKTLEVEIIGETETLVNPLQMRLLAHPDVTVATVNVGHPLLDNPKLRIEVTKGKAITVLSKVAQDLIKEFESFEKELEKAWKKHEKKRK